MAANALFPMYNSSEYTPNLEIEILKGPLPLASSDHGVLDFMSSGVYDSNATMFANTTLLDHTDDSVDGLLQSQQEQLELLNYWINGIITNVVVILGMIGNLLTIVILSQRAMRSSTNYYLSALAVWDSIVLISTVFLIGLPGIPLQDYINTALAYVVSYLYPLALIAQTATIWLTVSFTVERYIAVCHPLRAATMCTISRAKIVIICVSLGSSLYNIPRWFDYQPSIQSNPSTNETIVVFGRTEFSQNHVYLQVYFSWLYVPTMCIVPLLVLSILNLFLILAVRRSQRQRKDMNVKQSRENNVTIMLVTVVIVFIICQVPALVYNIAFAIDNKYVESSFGYQVLSTFRNFLVNFNSAINFLLYCALGQKFRRIFLHTFFRRCIHETYIPMSGIHHPTNTVVANNAINKGYYKSRPLGQNKPINSSATPPNSTIPCTTPSIPPAVTARNTTHQENNTAAAAVGVVKAPPPPEIYGANHHMTSSYGASPCSATTAALSTALIDTQTVTYSARDNAVTAAAFNKAVAGTGAEKRNSFQLRNARCAADFVVADDSEDEDDDLEQTESFNAAEETLLPASSEDERLGDPLQSPQPPPPLHAYNNGNDISGLKQQQPIGLRGRGAMPQL